MIVERKKRAGCGTFLGVLILIGLAVKYWYVVLGILVLLVAIGLVINSQQRQKELEKKRHRPGPRDPWLNEVAVALADLGLTEIARNTGGQLGGVLLEGDIAVEGERLVVHVNLFSDRERARQAETGLRAKPDIRNAIASGQTLVKADDRVLYVATGRGGVVDEFGLEEITRTVGQIELPPPLEARAPTPSASQAAASVRAVAELQTASRDALEQLEKLAKLWDAGVLNEAEFEAKKAELLRRV